MNSENGGSFSSHSRQHSPLPHDNNTIMPSATSLDQPRVATLLINRVATLLISKLQPLDKQHAKR
jgi:hypothetical protein